MSLNERPACAALVGLVANSWAWLEYLLGELFEMATAEIFYDENSSIRRTSSPIAIASFGALESISARLGVIEASLEMMLPEAVPGFEALAIKIRRCAKGRNQVVHGCWGTNPKYPNDVIRMPLAGIGRYIKWTPKDFANVMEQIGNQIVEIAGFTHQCMLMMHRKLPSKPV